MRLNSLTVDGVFGFFFFFFFFYLLLRIEVRFGYSVDFIWAADPPARLNVDMFPPVHLSDLHVTA